MPGLAGDLEAPAGRCHPLGPGGSPTFGQPALLPTRSAGGCRARCRRRGRPCRPRWPRPRGGRGVGQEDDGAGGRVERLAVERERRAGRARRRTSPPARARSRDRRCARRAARRRGRRRARPGSRWCRRRSRRGGGGRDPRRHVGVAEVEGGRLVEAQDADGVRARPVQLPARVLGSRPAAGRSVAGSTTWPSPASTCRRASGSASASCAPRRGRTAGWRRRRGPAPGTSRPRRRSGRAAPPRRARALPIAAESCTSDGPRAVVAANHGSARIASTASGGIPVSRMNSATASPSRPAATSARSSSS